MNKNETKKTTTKRLALTRQTLRTLTTDELRLVGAGRSSAVRVLRLSDPRPEATRCLHFAN